MYLWHFRHTEFGREGSGWEMAEPLNKIVSWAKPSDSSKRLIESEGFFTRDMLNVTRCVNECEVNQRRDDSVKSRWQSTWTPRGSSRFPPTLHTQHMYGCQQEKLNQCFCHLYKRHLLEGPRPAGFTSSQLLGLWCFLCFIPRTGAISRIHSHVLYDLLCLCSFQLSGISQRAPEITAHSSTFSNQSGRSDCS